MSLFGWKGANDTNWKTELEIYNPERVENCFKLKYVERGEDGSNIEFCGEICIEANKGVILNDVIYRTCGRENTA